VAVGWKLVHRRSIRLRKSECRNEVVVGLVGGGDGVECDDAGSVDVGVGDVPLLAALLGGKGLLLQSGQVDELVAPQAAIAREDGADDAEDVEDLAVVADLDLGPIWIRG
jgi:hypothetical protein